MWFICWLASSNFVAVLVLHTVLSKSCLDYSSNPCLAANHEEIDDATRSAAYTRANGNMMSDYSLPAGWYRSVSPAAGDMPRTAPEMFYCKATNPIWLNGPLPTEEAGIVMRTACARRYASVCHREYPICIKNCGTFNVYYLQTALTPDDRYCFGSASPCPNGQIFSNGLIPGCHDVCTNYDVLDVGDGNSRSALYLRERNSLQCDAHRFVPEKYYRLVGDNGADFVLHEGCVKKNHCSTVLPVWIKDTHPTDQNMTELTVCTTRNKCCSNQWKVKVKLCYHDNGLGFYVYRLSGIPMCDMGYCVMAIEDLPNRPRALPLHRSIQETGQCVDNPETKLKLRKSFSYQELRKMKSKYLKKQCKRNKQKVRTRCCSTCVHYGSKKVDRNCSDHEDYQIKLNSKVNCMEYAALKKKTMKQKCQRNRNNFRNKCCATCDKVLGTEQEEECPVLFSCPNGITETGPCSKKSLAFRALVKEKLNTIHRNFYVTLTAEAVVNYRGEVCASAQIAPLTNTSINGVRLLISEISKRKKSKDKYMAVQDGNWPPLMQITYPMKAAGAQMRVIMQFFTMPPEGKESEHQKLWNMDIRGCACASD